MQGLLAWVPLLPLIGFLILVGIPLFYRREPPESVIAVIGVGSVGIAALFTAVATAAVFGKLRPEWSILPSGSGCNWGNFSSASISM